MKNLNVRTFASRFIPSRRFFTNLWLAWCLGGGILALVHGATVDALNEWMPGSLTLSNPYSPRLDAWLCYALGLLNLALYFSAKSKTQHINVQLKIKQSLQLRDEDEDGAVLYSFVEAEDLDETERS